MLSEKAKQLIPKARIFSVANIETQYPESVLNIFQKADDNGQYLSDSDIKQIKENVPDLTKNLNQAQLLRDKAEDIVEQARKEVLEKFPQITQPGGELYPPIRAESCWRDFWHFLRTISYGIGGRITDFTSEEGLINMELLYKELKVPLAAMIVGLENLKTYSLVQFSSSEKEQISIYFEHLITKMKKFVP